MSDQKKKALESAMKDIEKQFGKGAIDRLGNTKRMNVDVIPTDILSLDLAMGVGGLPKGRIIEIFGPESSGKTTVSLCAIAAAQRRGGDVAFIDAEHALDPEYAELLGVDIDNLLISQPNSGEEALEITDTLVRSGAVDMIVIDSVAALVPKSEIEGLMGDSHVGAHARLMAQALRKLTGYISKTNTVVIFINQLREKVGVIYGNPEVTTGGRALKFASSVRLEVRKAETLKVGGDVIGNRTKVKVVKNKVAAPFKEAFFDIIFGEGVSTEGVILDYAVEFDIVTKAGAWFSYGEQRMGQGKDAAKAFLNDNPELQEEIKAKVMKVIEENTAKNRKGTKDTTDDAVTNDAE
ncbi:MAG: recombinase RecA [Clostridia bacterium]|nr:recombinase RecA [Clostridia bacterium]